MQNRSEKEQAVADLHDKLERAKVAIVAHPNKMDVATVTELRKAFRQQKIDYRVVKNTLARRAAKGTSAEILVEGSLFKGPTALIVGYDDPVTPAKVLFDFIAKKSESLSVCGAALDGKLLDGAAIETLSKLPSLDGLRAMLLGMFNRPAQMLATVVAQPATSIARVIEAHCKPAETE
ncbi:MAG: 50S ribosomal protein L10 [Myxococcales bacterium]|nr:50S ribosomal protein L10 [Myxococcales bacterium]